MEYWSRIIIAVLAREQVKSTVGFIIPFQLLPEFNNCGVPLIPSCLPIYYCIFVSPLINIPTGISDTTLRTALISVTCVLVMMSALTFIIGVVCGHCLSQRWRKSAATKKNDESPSDPTAEDLELKENVAYITIRPK